MRATAGPVPETQFDRGGCGIRAVAVRKRHRDGTTAPDSVTLNIRSGRLTAIAGPQRRRKTTLLAAPANLAPADGGTVSYQGDAALL